MSVKADNGFPARLAEAAKHAHCAYSQSAIGNRVGVDRRTVDRWINGSLPSSDTIFAIADAFKVDARWLATGKGEMLVSGSASQLQPHEESLLDHYRNADPRWKLSLRLLAALANEDQIEASTDVDMVIARIIGKKPRYTSNERVQEALGDAPHVKRKVHR